MGARLSTPGHADRDQGDEQANGGRSYSGFLISGHARVHNGDHYTVQNYYSRSVPAPDLLMHGGHCASPIGSALEVRKRKRVEDTNYERRRDGNHNLDLAASQLADFSLCLQHQKRDQDAQRIAMWIRIVLDAMETGDMVGCLEHTSDELESFQDGLVVVNRVLVNPLPAKQRAALSSLVKKERRTSTVLVGGWQILLDTLKRTSLDAVGEDTTETMSTLQVLRAAHSTTDRRRFTVLFGETTDSLQRSVIYPTVTAFRHVGSHSEIFQLLYKSDDVDGLTRLLATHATLRDCDDDGVSLFATACAEGRARCVKFLLDHGADIDRMEYVYIDIARESWLFSPISWCVLDDLDTASALECTKLLIEAGADSTTTFHRSRPHSAVEKDAFSIVIRNMNPVDPERARMGKRWVYRAELIDLLLRGAYDDLGSMRTERGTSIWMEILQLAIQRRIILRPKLLYTLMNAGCDVAEACAFPQEEEDSDDNDVNGVSGLCLFVMYAKDPWMSNDLDVVSFLLNASGGFFGEAADGWTIFFKADDGDPTQNHEGSYWRDLLFSAVARANIDVKKHTELPPKMPVYTRSYTVWHRRCLCYLDAWNDFHLDDRLLEWLEKQPWPGDDTEAMYDFACGLGRDSMFEQAEARWRTLYTEFKLVQRALEEEPEESWRIFYTEFKKARQKGVRFEESSDGEPEESACRTEDSDSVDVVMSF